MKKFFSFFVATLIFTSVFALSFQESGRKSATMTINGGGIPSISQIDRLSYLDDFAFPYKAYKNDALSVFVQQSNEYVYSNGDNICIQLGLKANSRDFFPQKDVNYVIYLNNPQFLRDERGKNLFTNAIIKILENKTPSSRICIYVQSSETLSFFTNTTVVEKILNEISALPRDSDIVLSFNKIADLVRINENTFDWEVLCISDQDMFKGEEVQNAFAQIPLTFDDADIRFSYIGYGAPSSWASVNRKLQNAKGAIYYENTYKSLENRIYLDFDKFAHEKVENIKINISYAPWLKEKDKKFFIQEMNYDGHKMFMKNIEIPASFKIKTDDFVYAVVSVSYNCTQDATKTFYKTFPLELKFSSNPDEVAAGINAIVVQNNTLRRGANVLADVDKLCSNENYTEAIWLLDNHIKSLEKVAPNSKDRQIEIDLQNFRNLKKVVIQVANGDVVTETYSATPNVPKAEPPLPPPVTNSENTEFSAPQPVVDFR